jgi:precorrin-4/cobalt-precorrin-4 C11-methyltransferase
VVIAYRVGWPDQQFLYGTLSNIRKKVMEAKITRTALIFVGRGLNHDDAFRDSALYDKDHVHVLRVKRGNMDEREE